MPRLLHAAIILLIANTVTGVRDVQVFFANPLRENVWMSKKIAFVEVTRIGNITDVQTTVSLTYQELGSQSVDEHWLIFEANEGSKIFGIPLNRSADHKAGNRQIMITIQTDPGDETTEITGNNAKILNIIDDGCGYYLKIAVFLDSSSSYTLNEFHTMTGFVKNLSTHFPLAVDKTSFAVGQFDTYASIEIGFDQAGSYESRQFKYLMDRMRFWGGTTRIDRALARAKELFQTLSGSTQNDDPQPTKILLLVTDGTAPYDIDPYLPVQLELQRQLQVEIMAVGTRNPQMSENPDNEELLAISVGKQGNVFYMDKLDDLVKKIQLEGKSVCQ